MAIGTDRESDSTLSDINVTPLVDVMLVLLIIFMIVAPKLTSGMKVNLPKVEAAPVKIDAGEVIISVTARGEVHVGKDPVSLNTLPAALKEHLRLRGKNKVYLKADENVKYGRVAEVIAQVKAAGISGLGIITEPPKSEEKEKKP
jgi:biopolymer transport protein TolR